MGGILDSAVELLKVSQYPMHQLTCVIDDTRIQPPALGMAL